MKKLVWISLFANFISFQTASGEGAIVQGVLDQELTKQKVQWDETTDQNGREKKAENSQGDGIAGGVIATATGGTLIAIGTRMVLSGDLITQIAGADLIGKGTQQLAQGISDLASAGSNGAQKELLLDAGGDLGDPLPAPEAAKVDGADAELEKVKADVLSPEVREALSSKGINPDDFFNKASTGGLSNAKDVLNYFGETKPFGPEEVEQARILVDERLSGVFEERDKAFAEKGMNLMALSGGGSKAALSGLDSMEDSIDEERKVSSMDGTTSSTSPSHGTAGDMSALDALDALNALGDKGEKNKDNKEIGKEIQLELRKKGIHKKRDSIFMIARKSFQRFDQWRGQQPKVEKAKGDKTAMLTK